MRVIGSFTRGVPGALGRRRSCDGGTPEFGTGLRRFTLPFSIRGTCRLEDAELHALGLGGKLSQRAAMNRAFTPPKRRRHIAWVATELQLVLAPLKAVLCVEWPFMRRLVSGRHQLLIPRAVGV